MTVRAPDCIYCHRTLEGVKHRDPDHPFVCDDCMVAIEVSTPAGCSPHYAKNVLPRKTTE